jgi:hypothetical protein
MSNKKNNTENKDKRKEEIEEKKWQRPVGRRPTEPAQLTRHLEPSPTYPFAVFNLGTEAARWSISRHPIHCRRVDTSDEGRRPHRIYKTPLGRRQTLASLRSLYLSLFSPPHRRCSPEFCQVLPFPVPYSTVEWTSRTALSCRSPMSKESSRRAPSQANQLVPC